MKTYGRIIEIILRRLDYLERSAGSDLPRKDVLDLAIATPNEITKDISAEIRHDYDLIEEAISKLNIIDQDMPEMKDELLQLKKQVPYNYKLSTKNRREIMAKINEILGINRSDRLP